ncbi:unnamed protein product (macronuclear) [Paramecium tetraurelia]|uniref:Rieske domain-containing protein n=1 Tax=Paramecium tetraurelia TaxID=5888 RepID=A0CYB1_PARTE|nr:uncharacterized protein GSPATT00011378001 [Paramecium tetraurelia]CAK75778.1 unnamed protein product [Paramecium tetraurelia]|eukprot:XP_001443175.1 hypothetical protein (macronuclear) [Paramecium tetraurelia strain d4-2]
MRKILSSAIAITLRRTPLVVPQRTQRIAATLISLPLIRYGFYTLNLNDAYEVSIEDNLNEGEMREVQVGPKKEDAVLVCKVDGQIYCVSNSCPHVGAPLSAGFLVGDKVKCPFHNASFSVKDGVHEEGPMFRGLQTFPVKQENGQLVIRVEKQLLNAPRTLNMVTKGDDPTHVVIVGGGVSGQSAAETLRQAGFRGKITIITAEDSLPYDRTPMSKMTFLVKQQGLQIRPQQFYEQYGIDVLTNTTVESIDINNQDVVVGKEKIHYDKLLLATGGTARRPQLDGVNLGNVHTLRQFNDLESIRDKAKTAKNIVVVGASFIGMETASAIKKEFKDQVNITVVDSTTVPFERVLGKEVGGSLQKLHEANGVEFELNAGVKRIGGVGQVQRVDLLNGKSLQADLVILGTGIQPNNKLVKDQLKISPNGGIETDVFLKAAKNVYASGDISSYPYWATGEHVRIEHQNEAVRQGYVAALNILGKPTPLTDVPFFWTRQWDRTLAYSGVGQGFDEVIVDGDLTQQKFVAYYARKGRVVASASMNTPNAQMIISEALRLNVMPSVEDLKEKKVSLDDIKKIVLSKGSSCHCKRAGQCQAQL